MTGTSPVRSGAAALLVLGLAAGLCACGGSDHGASYAYGVARMKAHAQEVGAVYFECLTDVRTSHPGIPHYSVHEAEAGCHAELDKLFPPRS